MLDKWYPAYSPAFYEQLHREVDELLSRKLRRCVRCGKTSGYLVFDNTTKAYYCRDCSIVELEV